MKGENLAASLMGVMPYLNYLVLFILDYFPLL